MLTKSFTEDVHNTVQKFEVCKLEHKVSYLA